jgi:hypothetical protein
MKVDGGCHCGKVTYEAEIDPARVMVCHCTDCQALSGSAFRVVALTRPGSFRLLSGALRSYTKTGESGTPRLQSFCPDCGSPIHATTPGPEPKVHSLRVGTLRQRAAIMPRLQIWRRSALPWVADLAGLPSEQTQPPMDGTGAMR